MKEAKVSVTVKDRWNGHVKSIDVFVEADQYDSNEKIKGSAIRQIDESKYEVIGAVVLRS
jgi:hypothetical protein